MNLGSFDPGGSCAAYAIFIGSALVECGLSRTKIKDVFGRAQAHRALVWARMQHWGVTRVRGEAMVFRQESNKGDPQILIDLNLITGCVGTEWIAPHSWKGMVPKEEHQPKILSALSAKERALVEAIMPNGLRHNAIDAVGIGLNALGRLHVEGQCLTAPRVLGKRRTKRSAKTSTRTGIAGTSSARQKRLAGKRQPKPPSFNIAPFKMPSLTGTV